MAWAKTTPSVDDIRNGDTEGHWTSGPSKRSLSTRYNVSSRKSRITGGRVNTLRDFRVNGHQVTINEHVGDTVQVLIDDCIAENMSWSEVDNFVKRNTQ